MIIAFIQIGALYSGITIVFNEHPVPIVIMDYWLDPITAYQLKDTGIKRLVLNQFSDLKPPIVYLNLPRDEKYLDKILRESIKTGRGLRLFGEFYEKISSLNKVELIKNSLSIGDYIKKNPEYKIIYTQFIANYRNSGNNFIYIPLYSRY